MWMVMNYDLRQGYFARQPVARITTQLDPYIIMLLEKL